MLATAAKDKVRHKLAQQEEMSNLKGPVMIVHAWSKLANFPAKFLFCKQSGGRNSNTDKTICNISEGKTFGKYLTLFEN